jgi:hypothetical protein
MQFLTYTMRTVTSLLFGVLIVEEPSFRVSVREDAFLIEALHGTNAGTPDKSIRTPSPKSPSGCSRSPSHPTILLRHPRNGPIPSANEEHLSSQRSPTSPHLIGVPEEHRPGCALQHH